MFSLPSRPTLGFAAGLALEAALQAVSLEYRMRSGGTANSAFLLKWPNDVFGGSQETVRHPP